MIRVLYLIFTSMVQANFVLKKAINGFVLFKSKQGLLGAFGASHGRASLGRGPCANAIALATTPLHPRTGSNRWLKQAHLQYKVKIQHELPFGWPMKKAIRFVFQVLPSLYQKEHQNFVDKIFGKGERLFDLMNLIVIAADQCSTFRLAAKVAFQYITI